MHSPNTLPEMHTGKSMRQLQAAANMLQDACTTGCTIAEVHSKDGRACRAAPGHKRS